jgi:hypothetical protein
VGRGDLMVVPRTSRYVIELSADERDELERRARVVTAAPWRDVQRARMIVYAAEGRTGYRDRTPPANARLIHLPRAHLDALLARLARREPPLRLAA